MERVIVVGPPGSGKSTLVIRLADLLGCRHVVFDGLWWGPNWTEVGPDVFGEQVRAATHRQSGCRPAREATTDHDGTPSARAYRWPGQ